MGLKGIRTCVACGATSDKRDLVRFVRTPQGEVALDASGRAPGRGAYVCLRPECLERARGRRALERALRVGIDEARWARLEQEFSALCAVHSDVQQG